MWTVGNLDERKVNWGGRVGVVNEVPPFRLCACGGARPERTEARRSNAGGMPWSGRPSPRVRPPCLRSPVHSAGVRCLTGSRHG
ncbi:hypothetical protein SBD_2427 [Streptomyces bottropensis ATCC 25435]|uniref:Uncharacterized protein n=1 Tax=Streptomyces bottropensis ATCC 25435 TaxID=1054862 RepID=M3DEQ3_9ACTN|nr:hypothetical protein SBD_2427 [Streptomyces bottropensis ATCC 25435]